MNERQGMTALTKLPLQRSPGVGREMNSNGLAPSWPLICFNGVPA